jgi:hypothetical protein
MFLQKVIKWLFFLTAITLFGSSNAEEINVLISKLGSKSYAERENSARCIRNAGYAAIPHLEQHFDDPDLEIALKSRELYEEYMHIDIEGEMPSIWFLEPELRFPKGYDIIYSEKFSVCEIKCKIDIAAELYCDVKQPPATTVADQCKQLYFNLFDTFWRDPLVCSLAMKKYVRKELRDGRSKEEIKNIIERTRLNMEFQDLMYQTSDLKSNDWDYWCLPPGVMLPKGEFVFPSR